MQPKLLALAAAFGCLAALHSSAEDAYRSARLGMVAEIGADVAATSREIGKRALDPRVLEVVAAIPRHEFVPADLRGRAYENRPLPIGFGQTISQPYIVALMTDLLAVGPEDSVLEVGTGSGYQAAVLAPLVRRVFSVEIIPQLGEQARERLKRLGFKNVEVRVGDGFYGWEEQGPFDAVVVTAAAGRIPPPLLRQLKPGGRMVIPVGGPFLTQQLTLVEKRADGSVTTRQVLPVLFVPLTGGPTRPR